MVRENKSHSQDLRLAFKGGKDPGKEVALETKLEYRLHLEVGSCVLLVQRVCIKHFRTHHLFLLQSSQLELKSPFL